MYYFTFEATPRSDHPEKDEIAGAVVSCWIDRTSMDEAATVARDMIRAECWLVDEYEDGCQVEASDYVNRPERRALFEQALLDKEVLVFHRYPVDDPPAD